MMCDQQSAWVSSEVTDFMRSRNMEEDMAEDRHICHLEMDPVFSLFPSFCLPDVLCDPTDLIWRKGAPFEAIIGRTAPSSDGLLAEVFWGFSRL